MTKDDRPLSQQINTWIQTAGIVFAALWGFYEFVYKEIIVPKAAPVNVSVDLALEAAGTNSVASGLRAITIRIVARNPSTRSVDLLPSFFVVYGLEFENGNESFEQQLITNPLVDVGQFHVRHTVMTKDVIVATGNPFGDTALRPGEIIARSVVLHVPERDYDVLDAAVVFPTARGGSNLSAEWRYDAAQNRFEKTFFHVDKDGNRLPGEVTTKTAISEHEYQEAWSRGQLALAELTPEKSSEKPPETPSAPAR